MEDILCEASVRISMMIYYKFVNFRAAGDKGEPIRFRGQKVKGKGHSETTNG